MKLSFNVEKCNRQNIGQAKAHNTRSREVSSQLPKDAWFTPAGHHTFVDWDDSKLELAKSMAKRKDAVVAIKVHIQIGNQSDWRELPDDENPHGKPKKPRPAKLDALKAGVMLALEREFGMQNLVSVELHTDESTPHVQAVITPIKDGKLQAKAWLDGKASLQGLRERIHANINRHVSCSYEKGGRGGEPHDEAKAAGGPKGPQKEPQPGFLGKLKSLVDKSDLLNAAMLQIANLKAENAQLFSKLKAEVRKAEDRYKAMRQAEAKAANLERQAFAEKERHNMRVWELTQQSEQKNEQIRELQGRVSELEYKLNPPKAKEPELKGPSRSSGMSLG
jgi:hypothetical protein